LRHLGLIGKAFSLEPGEESEEVKLIDLGRRVVLSLRQNLVAKVHEHDNGIIYKQFIDLVGEIYTAAIGDQVVP
jgi:N utilization substance protein A